MSWPWSQLGLPGPSDLPEIRHAYAEKLKTTHPEEDPEGFQRLHSAYQLASRMARQQKKQQKPFPQPEGAPPSRPHYAMREDDIRKTEVPEEPPESEEDFDYDELLREEGERPRFSHRDDEKDFDYDELLREEGERPRRSHQDDEKDFDYDELLREEGERPRRSHQDDEKDFDYDELLREEGERPRRSHQDDEKDFDYDELLREEGERPRPSHQDDEEEEQDWDYERLFAEGEAERAEERRRRGEERRRAQAQAQAWARERQKAKEWSRKREHWQRQEEKNTYNRERQDQFRRQEERWQGTETILHTIEMMYNARAPKEQWQKFFASPLFQQTKGSLDLVFGLEDFVSTKNLSQEVKTALFLAYGFDKGVSRPELRPLFQMLLPAWKTEQKARAFHWKPMFFGILGALVFLFGICPLLDSGLIPMILSAAGLVFIAWVVKRIVVLGNQEKRARGQTVSKQQERRAIFIGIACVAGVILAMSWMRSRPSLDLKKILPTSDPREQTCRYLEEDFGLEIGALYNLSAYYASETYSNVFYLESDPTNRQFLAGPDGDRDTKSGQSGYTTNLPEMMMLWALKDFAYEWKIYNVDTVDRENSLDRWETGSTFVLTLPTSGAEDVITSLGALLEELSQETWYQAQLPVCEVVLCSREMIEGRLVLCRWHPADGPFDAAGVRELYETTFAHSYCAQLIKELELDWDFIREEGEHYTLTHEGMAVIRDRECYKLFGLDGSGTVALEYYVDLEQNTIYCLPGNFWATGNSEDQLSFYRLLHWGDNLGLFHLFYPWLRAN